MPPIPPTPLTPSLIDLADEIATLHHFLQQIQVLAEDLLLNWFERCPSPTQQNEDILRYDFNAARVKSSLLHEQTVTALNKSYQLRLLSASLTQKAKQTDE